MGPSQLGRPEGERSWLDWPASEPQVKWLEAMETMGVPMTRMMIRVDAEISDELSSAFPHLTPRHQRAHTTLTGDMTDQEELQGVLNLLSSLGISVVEVVTIPDG